MAPLLGWRVERRGGEWFAVKALEADGRGSTGPVWMRHRLVRVPSDADRREAEREVARLVCRNVLN